MNGIIFPDKSRLLSSLPSGKKILSVGKWFSGWHLGESVIAKLFLANHFPSWERGNVQMLQMGPEPMSCACLFQAQRKPDPTKVPLPLGLHRFPLCGVIFKHWCKMCRGPAAHHQDQHTVNFIQLLFLEEPMLSDPKGQFSPLIKVFVLGKLPLCCETSVSLFYQCKLWTLKILVDLIFILSGLGLQGTGMAQLCPLTTNWA